MRSVFAGGAAYLHWSFPDPAAQEGDEAKLLESASQSDPMSISSETSNVGLTPSESVISIRQGFSRVASSPQQFSKVGMAPMGHIRVSNENRRN